MIVTRRSALLSSASGGIMRAAGRASSSEAGVVRSERQMHKQLDRLVAKMLPRHPQPFRPALTPIQAAMKLSA